jgi:hypothetical protein
MKKQTTIILLALVVLYAAFVLINSRLENRTINDSSYQQTDLSSCSLVELDDDRIALTIPSDYVYGATASDLENTAKELGYESILLNSDGSATYTITKEQHQAMLADLAAGIREKLDAVPGSDSYDDISSIEANGDFTYYKVTLSSTTADFNASMSVMLFKMYGTMYNCFNGVTDETIVIEYYNKNGDLVASYDSTPTEE